MKREAILQPTGTTANQPPLGSVTAARLEPRPMPLVVGCIVSAYSDYGRELAQGVNWFAQTSGGWVVQHIPSASLKTMVETESCTGVITQDSDPALLSWLQSQRAVAVNVSTKSAMNELPTVVPDNYATGRMAAEHLLSRGFCHFAAVGSTDEGLHYSKLRLQGFRDRLHEAKFDFAIKERLKSPLAWIEAARTADRNSPQLRWLQSLPKPVGLFTVDHVFAPAIVRLCAAFGIRVPVDLALITADDDAVQCESIRPSISSISLNGTEVGFQAARLLQQLLAGAPRPTAPIVVRPGMVIARESTTLTAGTDDVVSRAAAYIENHCEEQLYVDGIASRVGVSRSYLQRLFVKHAGHSLTEHINRARVGRAKHLLRNSDLPIGHIARRCGFRAWCYFATVFRRVTGLTASQYRRKNAKP